MWQQFLERTFPAYQETTGRSGGAGAGAAVAVADDLEKGADKVEIGGGGQAKPRLNVRNTLTKWFVDCITCGALMNTVAFLLFMGIMKGYAWWHIWYNIKNVSSAPPPAPRRGPGRFCVCVCV